MSKVIFSLLTVSALSINMCAAAVDVKFSGYLQTQWFSASGNEFQTLFGRTDDISKFETTRVRIQMDMDLSDRASAVFSVDADDNEFVQLLGASDDDSPGNLNLRDAYVMLRLNENVSLQAGQFKVPFSSEIAQSDADRLAPEMALVNLETFGENPRDVGVMLNFMPTMEGDEEPWTFSVGAFNGSGPNTNDNNTDKDFFASVGKQFGRFGFRASYVTGDFTIVGEEGATNERNRWNVDANYTAANWMIEGQWSAGQGNFFFTPGGGGNWTVDNSDVEGGFAQLTFMPADNPWKIFVRWQTYDSDTDVSNNTTTGFLVGFAYDWDENVRLIAAYERMDTEGVDDGTDLITVRLQGRFN